MKHSVVKLLNFGDEIFLTLLHIGFDFDCVVVLCSQELLFIEEGFIGFNLLFEIRFYLFDADGSIEVITDKLGAECRWNMPFLADINERSDLKKKKKLKSD
jgi:hypothetical protein